MPSKMVREGSKIKGPAGFATKPGHRIKIAFLLGCAFSSVDFKYHNWDTYQFESAVVATTTSERHQLDW
jgi:hypothetical protein